MAYMNQCLPLSERIKLLKQDADEKGIFGKASEIAKRLGNGQTMRHGINYTYDRNGLKIWYDDYGPNLSVTYNGTEVFFKQLQNVVRYRPDISGWIAEIALIYSELVKPKIDAQEEARKLARQAELYALWGITQES